jgi:hypothetical protein
MSIRVPSADQHDPRRPSAALIGGVVVALLAVLLVVQSVGGRTETTPTTTPSSEAGIPLVDTVPGLEGRVVVSFADRLQIVDGDTVSQQPLPKLLGGSLRPDASGTALAGLDGRTLWAGPVSGGLAALSGDVESFAWHRRSGGDLAWLESQAGTATLVTAAVEADSPINTLTRHTLSGIVPTRLAVWDVDSYVIEATDGRDAVIVAFGADGAERWRRPGQSASAHDTDQVLIRTDGPGGVEYAFVSQGDGSLVDRWFFPNSVTALESFDRRLALVTLDGAWPTRLLVVDAPTGTIEAAENVGYNLDPPTWSPDGRFVLAPGNDDLGGHVAVALDTVTGTVVALPFGEPVLRIDVLAP